MPVTSKRPRIALLSLGGTIGALVNAKGRDADLALDASDFLQSLPVLGEIAELEPQAFLRTMSADLRISDIAALALEIKNLVANGVDGLVVTQGTDTIEETAFLLDLFLDIAEPVIVTGAMRNPGKPGEDGPANLVAAVRVAASKDARDMGVLVTLDDTVHLARFVYKSHTFATGTFASSHVGPVGYVVENRVRLPLRASRATPTFLPDAKEAFPQIALITLSLGDCGDLLRMVKQSGFTGLVIESFGAGHVPSRFVEELAEIATLMPVVFASRTGNGELYQISGSYPGSEGDLLSRGLISAVGLDGPKSRLLLTLLVASGVSRDAIADAFDAMF